MKMDPHHIRINGVSILQWNSRSAVSNRSEIIQLIKTYDVQIAAISETWFPPLSHFEIPGFTCLRDDRWDGKGGAAMFIQRGIPFAQINILPNPSMQIVAAVIYNVTFVSTYIPPRSPFDITCWNGMVAQFTKSFFILGDCNAHSRAWGCSYMDSSGKNVLDFVDNHNLCVLNNGEPTRMSPPNQRRSAVDITLCTADLASLCNWEIINDPQSSDHFPILLTFGKRWNTDCSSTPRRSRGYNLKKAKWEEFKSLLKSNLESFKDTIEIPSSSNAAHKLRQITISAADISIPKKRPNRKNIPNPPWWDEECSVVVQERQDALRHYKNDINLQNFVFAKNAQANAKRTLKRKKRQGWRNFCTNLSPETHLSEVWNSIKRFRGTFVIKNHYFTPGSWINDFVDRLAPPYVPCFSEFPSTLPSQDTVMISELSAPFSHEELLLAIEATKDSSPGEDLIPYAFIRNFPKCLITFLLNLFNLILSTGIIPLEWKKQIIIPIPKPGKDLLIGSSYRPIALSCCFLKILERMIKFRLEWYTENKNILPPWQFGFRKGRSCLDSISVITTDINIAFASKSNIAAAFLDINSAYDNVILPLLNHKLINMGIPHNISQLIFNILSERCIQIEGPSGQIQRVIYKGLPQGSVLSPILFNIYTSDLQHIIPSSCNILQYADDFVVYAQNKDIHVAASKLQDGVSAMFNWLNENGLNLSPTKSQIVIFSRKHKVPDVSVQLNGSMIPVNESVKFLGVILHRKMMWNQYVDHIVMKCEKGTNILRAISRVWWGSHPETMKLLYVTLVRSHLDYGCQFMDPLPEYLSLKLQKIQSKCLRMILGAMRSSPINSLQVECAEMPLHFRRELMISKFLIKKKNCDSQMLFSKIETLFKIYSSQGRLRSKAPPNICTYFQRISSLNLSFPQTSLPMFSIPFQAIIFRPNTFKSMGIDRSASQWNDSSINQCFASEVYERWPNYTKVFTDGSKLPEGICGAAVFIPERQIERKFILPKNSSVYTAECVALREALSIACTLSIPKTVVFTDSLSLVQKLQGNSKHDPHDDLFWKIKNLLYELSLSNCAVDIVWIPSHMGISGNESVDRLAKDACVTGLAPQGFIPPVTEFIINCENIIRQKWFEEWQASCKGKRYKNIQCDIPRIPWFQGKKLSKQDISQLCRMRIGHCLVAAHLYRIKVVESPSCTCGAEEETIDHVFFECSLMERQVFEREIRRKCVTFPVSIEFLLSLQDPLINFNLIKFLNLNERLI
jgi:ribonuclease HI